MIESRAPGKLFIAGEHAIVDAGEPAVLVAVDRFLTVRLRETSEAGQQEASRHVRAAVAAVERLRDERGLPVRHYELQIESELNDPGGRKFGLGSSGAVTVATIGALNELYDLGLDTFSRFQLALLATIEVSPKASGGDLAASTFGGWVRYVSPDREALRAHRSQHGVSASLDPELWGDCSVSRLPAPSGLRLFVGWTGAPASTERLVDRVQSGRQESADEHADFLAESRACVEALASVFERGGDEAPRIIGRLRRLLQRLSRSSGTPIETERLAALCDSAERHGAFGKPSGAGGGDCGIVLAGPEADSEAMLREWSEQGIVDLDLAVHPGEGEIDEC